MLCYMNATAYTLCMEFRIRQIPEQLWKEFKILCIREDLNPNDKLLEMIHREVEKSKEKG